MISQISKVQTFVFLMSLLGSQLGWHGVSGTAPKPVALAASPIEKTSVVSQDTAAISRQGFTGNWYTNVAVLTLQQNGSTATGSIKGYGDSWDEVVSGNVNGRILDFGATSFFGNLAIELSADGNSFKSTDPELSFCGVRKGPLPTGCGFSGQWYWKTGLLSKGSYAVLTQTGSQVTGKVYSSPRDIIGEFVSGDVKWGKGWWLNGTGTNHLGNFELWMTSNEKAFQIYMGDSSVNWCGLRKNETQAWVFSFWCTP